MSTAAMNGKLDSLLDRLEGVRDSGGGQYSACCPAHDDSRASLSVKVSDGEPAKIILYCHAGCETKDILAKVNLTVAELFADKPAATNGKPQIVATYDYCDELGKLLFQSVRYQPKDFRQRQPGDGSDWNWSTKGVRRVVYHLPDIANSKKSWPVFVVEGEKDADRLRNEGVVATCNVGGANKWRAEDTKCIDARHVVVLEDNDEAGRKHAQSVAQQCHGTAASVKVLELPDLPHKGDVSDWLDAGNSAEELCELARSAEVWRPGMDDLRPDDLRDEPESETETKRQIAYARITSKELAHGDYELEYLISGVMVAGQPLIAAGPQKTLKTSFIIDAAISLASGGCFLGRFPITRPCRVAVMTGESGLATIQETAIRICIAAGKQLDELSNLIWSPDLPRFGDARHMQALERFLADDGIEVLFIDPAYLAMPGADAANLMIQGELLRSVGEVCGKLGVTMVLAHHTKKHTGRDAYDPGELSDISWSGFAEFARQWWLINRREAYTPGTGDHKLWLSVGGSAGHSSLWAVDVAEGVRSEFSDRKWEVELSNPEEAHQDAAKRRDEAKAKAKLEQGEVDIEAVLKAAASLPDCQGTKTAIRTATGIRQGRFDTALASLVRDKRLTQCEVTLGNNRKYGGYKLNE